MATLLIWPLASASGQTPDSAGPPVSLPDYFRPATLILGQKLAHVGREAQDALQRDRYANADKSVALTVERLPCDDARCKAVLDNAAATINASLAKSRGRFRQVSPLELRAETTEITGDVTILVYRLPQSLQFWTVVTPLQPRADLDGYVDRLGGLVNRLRYEEARAIDNVTVGRWAAQIQDHAARLLKAGDREAALEVLRTLLPSAPNHYRAQIDLALNSGNEAEVRNAAGAVISGAEDSELRGKAAALLRQPVPELASLPLLEKGNTGLQVILIPLAPCDASLLEAAAKVYERITDVPVRIRRLPESWTLAAPDRVPDQKRLQQMIVQAANANVDFTGWTRERYAAEAMKTATGADPLRRYFLNAYLRNLEKQPGQYNANPHIEWLLQALLPYRGGDRRTMFVGVTEANIYIGDSNYVFSAAYSSPEGGASILSYSMMMAKTFGLPTESRRRLVERMAKELVPASLKLLGIPRAADPEDPYSYSDGVERLDQKTLTLSAPVKAALDAFRR